MSKERAGASSGQKAALKRFPDATRHFNDFSMAQGYATCYNERVEPLLTALRALVVRPAADPELEALLKKYDG